MVIVAMVIVIYFLLRIIFPPQITDQVNNPQLQNVNQAIELISGQTIKD
jgi:hypothetical protein